MRRENDQEAQIEHHMKKQIDFARRDVARYKRDAECKEMNKSIYDDYFIHKNFANYRANDVYKRTKKIDINELEFQ
jgi:hypothetical protein